MFTDLLGNDQKGVFWVRFVLGVVGDIIEYDKVFGFKEFVVLLVEVRFFIYKLFYYMVGYVRSL